MPQRITISILSNRQDRDETLSVGWFWWGDDSFPQWQGFSTEKGVWLHFGQGGVGFGFCLLKSGECCGKMFVLNISTELVETDAKLADMWVSVLESWQCCWLGIREVVKRTSTAGTVE